eukprot:TRINITY_DN65699_c0_g1_i1.p1 TRINITY_DN65699_c0_g1~~TRINITY_DN65699_c0_g1_i1.p1  ORF type:complete len:172 (-),score=15.74 TRINITY_DN65699_c0_g1_i1:319-834(-)
MAAEACPRRDDMAAQAAAGPPVAPDASMVPLAAFGAPDISAPSQEVAQGTAPGTAQSRGGLIDHRTWQRLERCRRALNASPQNEVWALLQDIAAVLLDVEDRTSSLTLVGARITETSRRFLRAKRLTVRLVLLCYMADFTVQGDGAGATVTYLHTHLNPDWQMFYEVTVSL